MGIGKNGKGALRGGDYTMRIEYPIGPKTTWQEQAAEIKSGEIEIDIADIPALLGWLQDMNWPGTSDIVQRLRQFGPELIEPIREVVRSEDSLWHYWILIAFVPAFEGDFWHPLSGELERLAGRVEEIEGANLEALYILATFKLAPRQWIEARLELIKTHDGYDITDYERINAALREM